MADKEKLEKFQEYWDTLTPEEKLLLKIELQASERANKIREEFDALRAELEGYGYELWSHNSSWTWATFSKNVLAEEPSLSVQLYKDSKEDGKWRAEISHCIRAIKITSGEFSFPHPDFVRVFETQVNKAANATQLFGRLYD